MHFLKPQQVKKEGKITDITSHKEVPEESEPTPTTSQVENVISRQPVINVQPVEKTQYFPKVDPKTHQVLLVPMQEMSRSYSKRTSTKGPKHPDLREDHRFYCENCPCNYSRKALLDKHVMFNCLKLNKDFVCDECGKKYFDERTVREHYYYQHKKVHLYHCMFCNEGFYFCNKITKHKPACPNQGGPKLYKAMIDLDPVLEQTFKRRIPVEMPETEIDPNQADLPQEVLNVAGEEIQETLQEEQDAKISQAQTQDVMDPLQQETQTATDILTQMSEGIAVTEESDDTLEDDKPIEIETIED